MLGNEGGEISNINAKKTCVKVKKQKGFETVLAKWSLCLPCIMHVRWSGEENEQTCKLYFHMLKCPTYVRVAIVM